MYSHHNQSAHSDICLRYILPNFKINNFQGLSFAAENTITAPGYITGIRIVRSQNFVSY